MNKRCALVDSGGMCLVLKVPRVENCKCPLYRTELQECFICGGVDLQPLLVQHNGAWEWVCRSCSQNLPSETTQNASPESDLTQ